MQVVQALQRPCGLRLSQRQLRAWSEFRAALYAWDGTYESLRRLLEPTQYLAPPRDLVGLSEELCGSTVAPVRDGTAETTRVMLVRGEAAPLWVGPSTLSLVLRPSVGVKPNSPTQL